MEISEEFSQKLMESTFGTVYDIGFIRSHIEWLINSKYRKYKKLNKFISEQVSSPDEVVYKTAQMFSDIDYDKRIVDILRFVRGYTTYITDIEQYGYSEHWATAKEVLETKKNDCDGINSTIHVLALLSGIPSYLLYSVIGDVRGGGHYWLIYLSPVTGVLYPIDGTYYYDSSYIPQRRELIGSLYKRMWYIFNDKIIWRPN